MTTIPPSGYPGAASYPESSQADLSLVLSILGAVFTVIGACCILFIVPGVALSGIGFWLGQKEITAIDAGQRNPGKRQTAQIGKWVGLIGLVIALIGFAVTVAFIGISFSTS